MNDTDLVRLLSLIADSLDRQNQAASGGLVRQAGRRIVELSSGNVSDGCKRCGVPLVQPDLGRRRIYCSTSCRHLARTESRRELREMLQ